MGGAVGLDFGAILALGDAMGADRELLADVLPDFEHVILSVVNGGGEGDDDSDHA